MNFLLIQNVFARYFYENSRHAGFSVHYRVIVITKKNVFVKYIKMTFAVARRPRWETPRRETQVCFFRLFRFSFSMSQNSSLLLDSARWSWNARDFLRLFMEMREVCESISRDSEKRKGCKREERDEWGKWETYSRAIRESSCTCMIPSRRVWYARVWYARVYHESTGRLQETCIIISKSSPREVYSAYRATY